jgi:hypothetical protein
MQLRKLLACLLIGVFALVIVPSIHAQTTSVTVLSSPTSVVLNSNGTAQFDATIQARYAGLNLPTSKSEGPELVYVILNYFGSNVPLNGTVASSPDPCQPSAISFMKAGVTGCAIFTTSSSGTETVSFHVIIYNAAPRRYHFEVGAIVAVLPLTTTYVSPKFLESSISTSDFYVSVVNGATTTSTTSQTPYVSSAVTSTPPYTPYTYSPTSNALTATSTPSLQMPQPPQPTAIQSTNNTQLVLALAVIAAIVLGGLFLYSRRKGQPKVTQAEKVDIDATRLSTKTVEGKRFCIECGNELSPNLKFCDSCGTKQP